ncbi:beta-lactamase family protein [Sphingomonas sinipercae]|uniref:Beta-lactamase family protein n=1 Tax=Sphingomonas sinipercae TaxID=2714944 RepID=A0A6G7ZQJ5_9SPHN|nr:serine hydrolase domain-containing protein [Sphingomonas sinipercae]QIL03199.1 beta-lactamase family protein [Sphingomonas sinipercae]
MTKTRLRGSLGLLAAVSMLAGAAAQAAQPERMAVAQGPQATGKAIIDCAATFAEADEFLGVVMVQSGGRTIASAAYGMADPSRGVRNRLETPFNIASAGKIFTSTAIGQLIDRGKVRLDDKARTYLPELPAAFATITVGQLLDHSSGLPEAVKDNPGDLARATTARELVPTIAAHKPLFEPGTQHRYSNTGPILSAAIVEAVTGMSFSDYVQRHVFGPAGMKASTVRTRPADAAQMLTRSLVLTGEMHIVSSEKSPRRVSTFTSGGGPYGGGYSNAPDLLRFARTLTSGKLLSARTRAELWGHSARVPGAGPGDYAYGFQTSRNGDRMSVGHSGLMGGANAEVHWASDGAWSFVILSNYDPMSATIIGNAARLALLGLENPKNACAAAKGGRGMPQPTIVGPGPGPGGPAPGAIVGPAPGPLMGPGGGPVEAPSSSEGVERG